LTAVTINLRHRTSHLAASRSAGMGSGWLRCRCR